MLTAMVTGATDGIGAETARGLLGLGWRVLVHGRHEARAVAAVAALHDAGGVPVPVWADFSRMREVRALSERLLRDHPQLDVLINNAGVYTRRRTLTEDGFEETFAVNYYAHVLLTLRLLPSLMQSQAPRVVHVSSGTHESGKLDLADLTLMRGWDGYRAYSNTKLANVLFSAALAARHHASVLSSNALHPGVIGTKLLRAGFSMGGAPLADGARTSIFLATDPRVAGITGRYFVDSRQRTPSARAQDSALAEALWQDTATRLRDFLAD